LENGSGFARVNVEFSASLVERMYGGGQDRTEGGRTEHVSFSD
jgi:hypothetical protein